MPQPVPGPEIIHACRVLFPAAVAIDSDFLYTIANQDVKTAFRRKALKTHPDRSQALGRSQEELSRIFQDVTSAYDVLKSFLSQRSLYCPGDTCTSDTGRHWGYASAEASAHESSPFGKARCNSRKRTRPQPSSSFKTGSPKTGSPGRAGFSGRTGADDYYYQGGLPQRELRLGEYLYYSGIISWRTLIAAIVWQKRQRPLFGEIARQWNYLSDDDIRLILKGKTWQEMFGEYARRHGFLSHFQQMAVTGRQRKLQPLFGVHFVYNGLFTATYIDQLVRRKKWYNSRLRG